MKHSCGMLLPILVNASWESQTHTHTLPAHWASGYDAARILQDTLAPGLWPHESCFDRNCEAALPYGRQWAACLLLCCILLHTCLAPLGCRCHSLCVLADQKQHLGPWHQQPSVSALADSKGRRSIEPYTGHSTRLRDSCTGSL